MAGPTTPAGSDRQVLVVGGGVGGLVTTAALERRGFDPVVVGEVPVGRGAVTLWQPAIGHLDELGLLDELPTTDVRRWVVRTPGGTEVERFEHDGDDPPCVRVERSALLSVLRERLRASSLRLDKAPRSLEGTPSGPVVGFADGVTERFDVVVGADGTDSWVRSSAFEAARPTALGTTSRAFRTEPRLDARDTVYELWLPGGSLCRLGPLPDADAGVFVSRGDGVDPRVESLAALLTDGGGTDAGGPDGPGWTADRAVWPDRWATAGTVLLGDAAHSLPPAVTTGTTLAVEDAHVLAAALSAHATTVTALRSYEQDRRGRLQGLFGGDWSVHDGGGTTRRAVRRHRIAFLRSVFACGDDD